MGQLAIVNAPSTFTLIWSIIKPWLSKETVEKIDILGSNYQDVLLSLVDKENLPTILGGGCECEGGCEYSFAGPWKEGLEERRERRKREANRVLDLTANDMPVLGEGSKLEEVRVIAPLEVRTIEADEGHIGGGILSQG